MTAAQNIAITPRATRAFKFTRKRPSVADSEFFPGAGSRLRFANRDTDTLVAQGLPAGLLQAGDTVTVQYNGSGSWVTVFSGEVDRIVDRHGKGDARVQDVTVAGPWGKMNRLVFSQVWRGEANLPSNTFPSSRVILNQSAFGAAQNMRNQLIEILWRSATQCGFSYAIGDVPEIFLCLPPDEARDITCADALRRELRFFPKIIVRFDYSGATPAIKIEDPSTTNASYVASVPKTERVYEYNAHPVSCVDVAVDATDILVGGSSSTCHQVYPTDGDTTALDCLHVTVPLARGSSSTTNESFKSVTEDIPQNIATNAQWWKQKHPRLANVAQSAITITNGTRSPSNYPRIAKATKGEIEAAGLHCEVSRFTCDCKIETEDEEEESIKLTMDFLTTDARTRTYTWQTGSSSTEGETLPEGLAQALYEQRAQSLVNERMTVRLGEDFPKLGDAADGLFLQSFEVDVYDLTAQLSFGHPEHLSAEDMKSLLNGFRQRGYATTANIRKQKADSNADEAEAPGGIPPISSSEWSPGTKVKTAIKKTSGGTVKVDATSAGTVDIKTSDVGSGKTAQFRDLTYTDAQGTEHTIKVLATEEATLPPPGSSPSGSSLWVVTGLSPQFDDNNQLVIKLAVTRVTVLSKGQAQYAANPVQLPLWKQDVVTGSTYNEGGSHKFENSVIQGVRVVESNNTTQAEVFVSTPHSSET